MPKARVLLASAFIFFAAAGRAWGADAQPSYPPDPSNPLAQRSPARSTAAVELYGRLDDDRAVVHVTSGPPDARAQVSCPLFRPLEVWTYLEHPVLGRNVQLLFFREETGSKKAKAGAKAHASPAAGADAGPRDPNELFRYWTVADGEGALFPPAERTKWTLQRAEAETGCPDAPLVLHAVRAIAARQGDASRGTRERARLAVPRLVPPGGAPAEIAAAVPSALEAPAPLSEADRVRLRDALPERFRQFLEDVHPIAAPLERDVFLRLTGDERREAFIADFWNRRSLGSDGPRLDYREVYMLRLRETRDRYGGPSTEPGRVFLLHGPPDRLRRIACRKSPKSIEIWQYAKLPLARRENVTLVFSGDPEALRLWKPGAGRDLVDPSACPDARDVPAALADAEKAFEGGGQEGLLHALLTISPPDLAGLEQALVTTELGPQAAPLLVTSSIRFTEFVMNRMRTELALAVKRSGLTRKEIGDETFYDLDVVGEVLHGDKLIESFRYRFDFPVESVTGEAVAVKIERELTPGTYRLRVKVADANRDAAALIDEKLKVPDEPEKAASAEEEAAREAAREALANQAAGPGAIGSLTFLPLAIEVATGMLRFETRASSPDIAYATFFLNNQKVMTKRRPPFEANLDLGELPRRQVVKVIGYSKDGRVLAEDEMVLNEGSEAFRVRIDSPGKGVAFEGVTRVVAEVAVPSTKRLKHVEIFVNDTRTAVLYQAPFQQTVTIPEGKDLGILRVVATLQDGTSAEDLRYFHAPKFMSEVNVRAVELYTSVFQKGRPVTGLAETNFTVLEDGIAQSLQGFESVTNLPLSLGLAIDTSGSMEDAMDETQKAASGFLRDLMTRRDRCFLINFDDEPHLVARFSTDRDRLMEALTGLKAHGSTALWDSVIFGLNQFQGARGRKAYVLLTDGDDRSSKFSYDAALDYAKKSGVALYVIGLQIPTTRFDVRYRMSRLAKDTGGAVYYVESARALDKIYKEIGEELRNQYLLSYIPKSASASAKWRKIEVRMNPDNLTARTISGYYP